MWLLILGSRYSDISENFSEITSTEASWKILHVTYACTQQYVFHSDFYSKLMQKIIEMKWSKNKLSVYCVILCVLLDNSEVSA